jgi:ankyrin repeat protein
MKIFIHALHIAGKTNAVNAAEILIKHGADVSVRDCKQKTPLHLAARRGNIEVMKVALFECIYFNQKRKIVKNC